MAIVIFIMEFKNFSQEDYLVNKTYYCARKYPPSQNSLIPMEFPVLWTVFVQ